MFHSVVSIQTLFFFIIIIDDASTKFSRSSDRESRDTSSGNNFLWSHQILRKSWGGGQSILSGFTQGIKKSFYGLTLLTLLARKKSLLNVGES